MSLSKDEIAEILALTQTGHQASDLIPVLKVFIQNERLNDVSDVINLFVRLAEVNRPQIRSYLVARIPALLINFYWPTKGSPSEYDKLIEYTLQNDDWGIRIRNAVDFAGDLLAVMKDIENEAGFERKD